MRKAKEPRGAPVVVATARKGDVPIYLDEIGTVTATQYRHGSHACRRATQ